MSNEQRMCICGHQRRTHGSLGDGRSARWDGCWGIVDHGLHPSTPCPCEAFMWVKSKRLATA